jgi:ABC-type Mn2+/Zn2+ transport system ATPase subunit
MPHASPSHSHRLSVGDLTVSYNRIPAVHHVTFEVGCGQCIGLIGPNGAGKSTLLKALVGLLPIETGEIKFHGRTVHGATRDFAYLPQREQVDWDFPTTVCGLVEMGRYMRTRWWDRFSAGDRQAVDRAIEMMQLEEIAGRQISALSGGQQQRAFLARSLAQEAHVFLLDEPFAGLDKTNHDNLKRLLRELRAQGKLIIASHHDLASVPQIFDEVILLNGELIAAGPTATTFTDENRIRTFSTRAFAGPAAPHAHSHGMGH